MRKALCALLAAVLLPGLCACGAGRGAEESPAYYWRTEQKSLFPLGLNAEISGLAATESRVFVGGNRDGRAVLTAMDYTLSAGELHTEGSTELELPSPLEECRLLAIALGGEGLYALLCREDDTGGTAVPSYSVAVFAPDGSPADSFPVAFADYATPQGMLVLDDGRICLWSLHNLWLCSAGGDTLVSLSRDTLDFGPPLLIDGELILQTAGDGLSSRLNAFDAGTKKLLPLEMEDSVGYAYSISHSAAGSALVNDGMALIKINPDYTTETVLEWYELTDRNGTQFRYLCQLDGDHYLLSSKGSGAMLYLSRDYRPDTRRTVRIGVYGQGSERLSQLKTQYNYYNPDYKVECVDYGADEQGLSRLLVDVGSGDKLDIVLSDGYQLPVSTAFTDLYPLLDGDPELDRAAFAPWLLEKLARKGALRQLWGSFSIVSTEVRGPLARGPEPLRLKDCQAYLDRVGYDGPLFDSYLTKDMLFGQFASPVLFRVYDAESDRYRLDEPCVKDLAELCNLRPLVRQDTNGEDGSTVEASEVLITFEMQMDHLERMNTADGQGIPHRFFDGSDGGDNLTSLCCDYRACYMIPETCADKENAWGFLRTLLKADWQTAYFEERRIGYPSNAAALEAVLAANASPRTQAEFYRLLAAANFYDCDQHQLSLIFRNGMQPYFYGDCTLEEALEKTQSRMDIYHAEHAD